MTEQQKFLLCHPGAKASRIQFPLDWNRSHQHVAFFRRPFFPAAGVAHTFSLIAALLHSLQAPSYVTFLPCVSGPLWNTVFCMSGPTRDNPIEPIYLKPLTMFGKACYQKEQPGPRTNSDTCRGANFQLLNHVSQPAFTRVLISNHPRC